MGNKSICAGFTCKWDLDFHSGTLHICGSFCRQDANAKPLKKYKEFSYLKPGWDCTVKNKHNWFTKNDNKNFKFLLFYINVNGQSMIGTIFSYCFDMVARTHLICESTAMLTAKMAAYFGVRTCRCFLCFCLIIPLPRNFHEWPRQNFSLQYQYNTNQISDENKEKYQFGYN